MHLRKLIAHLLMILMVSSGIMVVSGGPAAASPYNDCLTDDYPSVTQDGGACVYFEPYGEHLYVCDIRADGHHPAAWYWINGGPGQVQHSYLGYGTCYDRNLDLDEGLRVEYQAVNLEGNDLVCPPGPIRWKWS